MKDKLYFNRVSKKSANFLIKKILLNLKLKNISESSSMWHLRSLNLLETLEIFLNDFPNEGNQDIDIFLGLSNLLNLYKKTNHQYLKSYLNYIPGMYLKNNGDIDFDKFNDLSDNNIKMVFQNHGFLIMAFYDYNNHKNYKMIHVNGYELFIYVDKNNKYCIYYLGFLISLNSFLEVKKIIEIIENNKIVTVDDFKLSQILVY